MTSHSAPPSPRSQQLPPLQLRITGGLVGALCGVGTPFFLANAFQAPVSGDGSRSLGEIATGILVGGVVGLVSTRWCWEWAVYSPHPLLRRLEAWLPLRGRWLAYGAAGLLFPLHWGVLTLGVYFLGLLPCMLPVALVVMGILIGTLFQEPGNLRGTTPPDTERED